MGHALYGGTVPIESRFRDQFQTEPTVTASAPGRVNLIGEHLDYNGGCALPMPLTCRTTVAVALRDDGLLVMDSVQSPGAVEVPVAELESAPDGYARYVAGVVWALAARGVRVPGVSVLADGQVPLGSGLSSSAALEVAVGYAVQAVALAEGQGPELTPEEMVAACVSAENDFVGAPTGSMDQTVAIFAQPGHALLVDFAAGTHRDVPWEPPGDLVVIDTRAEHALVGGEYGERRRACEKAAAHLGVRHLASAAAGSLDSLEDPVVRRRAQHVVTEAGRVRECVTALEERDWSTVGALMTASHLSLRDDFEVSCPELDVAVDAALAAGAWGARMTGGGFGGSALALAPPEGVEPLCRAVAEAYAERGFRPPRFLDGTAGAPARVIRRA